MANTKETAATTMKMNVDANMEKLLLANLPILTKSMTFSKMMQMDKSAAEIIKNWGFFFPPICNRKDQAAMTATERERYICAFTMANNDGTLGQLVDLHAGNFQQHGNLRLLPWHRLFLHLFEEALHNYHPDVCIPYWDWTQPSEQGFPAWLAGVLPTVHTPTRTINVVRSPGAVSWLQSIVSGVPGAMAQTTYDTFSSPINGVHGGVHIWVGGSMSDPSTSPADPVFWLHHCNLDRLWWVWYNSAAGNHQNPTIPGNLAPWTYTEADTRSVTALGYQYV